MTAKNSLELKGVIRAYPVAEVVVEISQAELTGSLRVENGDRKAILYFVNGSVAYAVSNERKFRLWQILFEQSLIDQQIFAKYRAIPSDLQLADEMVKDGVIADDAMKAIVSAQCTSIISAAVEWGDGTWTFSPHARLKAGVDAHIDLNQILLSYARTISNVRAEERISNSNEWFSRFSNDYEHSNLSPSEIFVLSRLDKSQVTLGQLRSVVGDTVDDLAAALYSLWMGGLISRKGWQAAFSDERLEYLRSANLELKRTVKTFAPAPPPAPKPEKTVQPVEESAPFDLEECLKRIEGSRNAYETLGIDRSTKQGEVRSAYYRLAKALHPDRYRKEGADRLRQIERAFTEVAQAHEWLKTPEARNAYDNRMRQEEIERPTSGEVLGDGTRQGEQAAGDFERGFALQLEGEFEAAVPFLARAAYYSPNNARYRAYYGKALSADADQRHKAEKELVTAVKLEPSNAPYRLMLVEFLMKYKKMRRAE
jgi:tetratricopeptide (TPR) repeat protein